MPPVARSRFTRWLWLAAVVLMLAEFLLFDRMTSLHHASIYPRWNDQVQYLREAYTAFARAQSDGLLAGLKFALEKTSLQGTLHDFFAVQIFWLAGSASRSAALSLNMLVFLAWQAALLAVILRVTGSRTLAWMGFGLLLCLAGPWSNEPGSAVDFRLDHAAMCLMGLTAAVALLTDGFRSTRWVLILGVLVGMTLLERFLTGVYFAFIFVASVGWILCGRARRLRLRNLALAGLVAAAIALPVFWASRTAIYTYYWVGHITGAESAARLHPLNLWHSIQFIVGNLGELHLGRWFAWAVAAPTAALCLSFLAGRRRPAPKVDRDWLFIALAFLLLPAAVLCLHPQKSPYVLGVLVPGVVLLVLWVWSTLWFRVDFTAGPSWHRLVPAVMALAMIGAGEGYFVQRQLWQPQTPMLRDGDRQVKVIADHIFARSRALHLVNPAIGVDQIVDYLDAQILEIICYERHKVWTPFSLQLPQGILGEKDDVILYRLKLCDFVLLTDEMEGDGYWPYDHQMRRLYPELKAWCDSHLRLVDSYILFGRRMSLYERPHNP